MTVTIDEIYGKIASHMIKGMMIHEQLANYYDFLGLNGYKRCHEYNYLAETCTYRCLCRYYINHHDKLIPQMPVEDPKIIPESWYKYKRQDVDNATKKNAVKNGLTVWIAWEEETKELYQAMYKELINLGEVASACKVMELVKNVDCELKKAQRYYLSKKAIDYDLSSIIAEQTEWHEEYKCKEKKMGVKIC